MDAGLEGLWHNAMQVAEQSGVPAPALVAAYLDLVAEHGLTPPTEAILAIGQRVAAQFGPMIVLDDNALQLIADKHGLTVAEVRRRMQ